MNESACSQSADRRGGKDARPDPRAIGASGTGWSGFERRFCPARSHSARSVEPSVRLSDPRGPETTQVFKSGYIRRDGIQQSRRRSAESSIVRGTTAPEYAEFAGLLTCSPRCCEYAERSRGLRVPASVRVNDFETLLLSI